MGSTNQSGNNYQNIAGGGQQGFLVYAGAIPLVGMHACSQSKNRLFYKITGRGSCLIK